MFDWKVLSNEQQNRLQIYQTTVEIMEPHINKLKQFMFFQVLKSVIKSVSSLFLYKLLLLYSCCVVQKEAYLRHKVKDLSTAEVKKNVIVLFLIRTE